MADSRERTVTPVVGMDAVRTVKRIGLALNPTQTSESLLENLLLESIDETLTDLLGRRAKEAVYDCLERNRLLARTEIPRRLDVFFSLLEDNFGRGSKTIAKVILKRLYSKLGWEFVEIPSNEFSDYLDRARSRFERELSNDRTPAGSV